MPLNTNEHERLQVGFTGISEKKISGFAVPYRIFNLFFAANPKGTLKDPVGTELDPMNVNPQLAVYETGPFWEMAFYSYRQVLRQLLQKNPPCIRSG